MVSKADNELEQIQLRFALTFRKLLDENIKAKGNKGVPFNIVTNTNQLADAIQKRPATVSDIFNARSIPGGLTIHQILEGLGKSFSDFAKYYDSLTKADLMKFKSELKR